MSNKILFLIFIVLFMCGCTKTFCDKIHRFTAEIAQKANTLMDCNPKLVTEYLDRVTDGSICYKNPAHRGPLGMALSTACQIAFPAFANWKAEEWEKKFECNKEKAAALIGSGKSICVLFNLIPG